MGLIDFKNCLVAHIDVMGFKALLNDADQAKRKLNSYFEVSKEFLTGKSSIYNSAAPEDQFKSLFVSDSIILSVELISGQADRYLVAGRFFHTISLLQYTLAMKHQIWVRGAVSVGPLCMKPQENILVGQAYIDAFYLEKVADYPRVIIDPRVFSFFGVTAKEFCSNIKGEYDGVRILGTHSDDVRFGGAHFGNDALMIDWFRNLLLSKDNFSDYFGDLEKRAGQNQELFKKTNRLVPYLRESFFQMLTEEGSSHACTQEEIESIRGRIERLK